MSTGQTMLTAAFFVLLTVAIMTANKMLIDTEGTDYSGEAIALGTNYAQILMNEIVKKKFDQKADTTVYQEATSLTAPNLLGQDAGESFTLPDNAPFQSAAKYNDIDDYHGYSRTVNSTTITGFSVTAQVYYVTMTNTKTVSSTQTYLKRIDVSVEHSQYLSKMTLSTLVSY